MDADVIVIGAGPAGCAAAALLHRRGLRVEVFEQARFPRFVIGESLLPHCMDILDEAGLLEAVKARNYLVKNGALFFRGDERCSFSFDEQHTRGWSWTWQVPRADFDQTLAQAVAGMGVPVRFATRVSAVDVSGPPRVTLVDENGWEQTRRARYLIDASGYGRVLPRLLGLDEPSHLPLRMALFSHVRGDRRPPGPDGGRIWICLHPNGAWIWIIPFSDGLTSVGVVATPEIFARYSGSDEEQLRAILAGEPSAKERLAGVELQFAPQILKGYSASVSRLFGPNYCLVGNATEFLDPVFSSGVTLALESASCAAGLVARQLAGEEVDWQADYADHMMRGIDVFRTFVNRWYDGVLPQLFFGKRHEPRTRAQICSVLAGYVWDESNPIVREHARLVPLLARLASAPLGVVPAPTA